MQADKSALRMRARLRERGFRRVSSSASMPPEVIGSSVYCLLLSTYSAGIALTNRL